MTGSTVLVLAVVGLLAALLQAKGRRILAIMAMLILGALLGNMPGAPGRITNTVANWVLTLPEQIAGFLS